MLSDEEKKAIKELTEIKELFEEDLKENYEVTATLDQIDLESLVIVLNLIEKQSKEIEELKEDNEKYKNPPFFDEDNYTENDKIKAILGIEHDNNENILTVLQTIVDENARLENIEDRKVQIEYNNVFNKGVKSVEDKIKAKVIEIKDRLVKDEFITASQGKLNTVIDMESLLEKE